MIIRLLAQKKVHGSVRRCSAVAALARRVALHHCTYSESFNKVPCVRRDRGRLTIHVLRWLFQPFFRAPLDAFLLTLLSNNRAPMGAHGHGGAWALPRALASGWSGLMKGMKRHVRGGVLHGLSLRSSALRVQRFAVTSKMSGYRNACSGHARHSTREPDLE